MQEVEKKETGLVSLSIEHLVKNQLCKTYLSEKTGKIGLLQLKIGNSLPPKFFSVNLSIQSQPLTVGKKVKFVGREDEGTIGKIISIEEGEAGNKYTVEDVITGIVDIYYTDDLVDEGVVLLPNKYCIAIENTYYKIKSQGNKLYKWVKTDPRNDYENGTNIVLKVNNQAVVFKKKDVIYVNSYYKIIAFLDMESQKMLDKVLSEINSIKKESLINKENKEKELSDLQEQINSIKKELQNLRKDTTKICNSLLYSVTKPSIDNHITEVTE